MRGKVHDHALLDRSGRWIDQPVWRRLIGSWLAILSGLAASAIGILAMSALLGLLAP